MVLLLYFVYNTLTNIINTNDPSFIQLRFVNTDICRGGSVSMKSVSVWIPYNLVPISSFVQSYSYALNKIVTKIKCHRGLWYLGLASRLQRYGCCVHSEHTDTIIWYCYGVLIDLYMLGVREWFGYGEFMLLMFCFVLGM